MRPTLTILAQREPVTPLKRGRLPLKVRYKVLRRQCPADIAERIEAKGGKLKDRYAKLLYYAECAITGERLVNTGAEFDHITPRALGGTNDADNIQAITPKAHRKKTDADDAAIAKANRCAGLTGQVARRARNGPQIKCSRKLESRNDLGGEEYQRRKRWKEEILRD